MIINNANLVTFWPSQPLVEGALIAIEGKTIVDFGKVGKLVDRYDDPDVIDVGGRLVLPGLVNAHSRPAMGLALTRPPVSGFHVRDFGKDWISALDPEAIYWGTFAGLLDSVRAGVTTVFAFHSSPTYVEGSFEALSRAFGESGLRGCLAYAISARSAAGLAIRESTRQIEACRNEASELLTALFGLEASTALELDTLSVAVTAAAELGVPLHVTADTDQIHRLALASALEGTALLVVTGEVRRDDEAALAGAGLAVTHSPQSDLVFGNASPDLLRAVSIGSNVALGTNGIGESILQEFRTAAYRQRAKGRSLGDAVRLAHRAAFTGNGAVASRVFGRQMGVVKPGARADLVVLDYVPSTPVLDANLPEHLMWGASCAAVATVIVNGRVVYRDGRSTLLDEERIRARAREIAQKLWA